MSMFYLLVVCNVFMSSVAQLLLKSSSLVSHKNFICEYFNIRVIAGYSLMMVALLSNIYAMRQGILIKEVSIIESLSYLFVPILSYFVFNEQMTKRKIVAISLIICGIVMFFM